MFNFAKIFFLEQKPPILGELWAKTPLGICELKPPARAGDFNSQIPGLAADFNSKIPVLTQGFSEIPGWVRWSKKTSWQKGELIKLTYKQ